MTHDKSEGLLKAAKRVAGALQAASENVFETEVKAIETEVSGLNDQEILFLCGCVFSALAFFVFCGWYIKKGHDDMKKCCEPEPLPQPPRTLHQLPPGMQGGLAPWDPAESVASLQAMQSFQFGDATPGAARQVPAHDEIPQWEAPAFPSSLLQFGAGRMGTGDGADPRAATYLARSEGYNPLDRSQSEQQLPNRAVGVKSPNDRRPRAGTASLSPTQVKLASSSRDPELKRELSWQKKQAMLRDHASRPKQPNREKSMTLGPRDPSVTGGVFPKETSWSMAEFHREDTGYQAPQQPRQTTASHDTHHLSTTSASGRMDRLGSILGMDRGDSHISVPPTEASQAPLTERHPSGPPGCKVPPAKHVTRGGLSGFTKSGGLSPGQQSPQKERILFSSDPTMGSPRGGSFRGGIARKDSERNRGMRRGSRMADRIAADARMAQQQRGESPHQQHSSGGAASHGSLGRELPQMRTGSGVEEWGGMGAGSPQHGTRRTMWADQSPAHSSTSRRSPGDDSSGSNGIKKEVAASKSPKNYSPARMRQSPPMEHLGEMSGVDL